MLSGREVEKDRKEAERKEKLAQFKAGDVVEGTVDSLKNYGAFIKLADGVDGLLHVSQISTQRIKHPGVVLKEGQSVKVKILSVADGKISLSMKALTAPVEDEEQHERFDYRDSDVKYPQIRRPGGSMAFGYVFVRFRPEESQH